MTKITEPSIETSHASSSTGEIVSAVDYDLATKAGGWDSPKRAQKLAEQFIRPRSVVVDIGSGTGQAIAGYTERGAIVHALDHDPEMLAVVKSVVGDLGSVREADINDVLPLGDLRGTIDVAQAIGVSEFANDWGMVVDQLYDSLKPGGVFIFTTETVSDPDNSLTQQYSDQGIGTVHRYDVEAVRAQLTEKGFTVSYDEAYDGYERGDAVTGKVPYHIFSAQKNVNQSPENRQTRTSSDEQEHQAREDDARKLTQEIVGKHGDFFNDPINRLDFIQTQDASDFMGITQHVNARLRGEVPHELRKRENEKGGFLPLLHTPSYEDKPLAFKKGYEAIQDYIVKSSDSTDKKNEGVAMALEALVIWVHPFNDGNGRTGRFLGKLIEDGVTNVDTLVAEAASSGVRRRVYGKVLASKESELKIANNEDIMLDDVERREMREKADHLSSDIDAVYLSVKRLLEDDSVRSDTLRHVVN